MNDVTGTHNDFDQTPWCTKEGSCQATSSQIPKTCCKDVTQRDYRNASSRCYSSVIPGTYKSVSYHFSVYRKDDPFHL